MAESTPKQTKNKADDKTDQSGGNVAPEVSDNADSNMARKSGITEGDVKALRDDAGLNQLAGSEADIHAWSLTEAGKKFAKEEKDRNAKEKESAKAYSEQFNKDGLTEAEAKYREVADKS